MKHSAFEGEIMHAPSHISVSTCHLSLQRGRELRVEGCMLMRIIQGEAELSINASHVHVSTGMLLYMAFDMTVITVRDSELDVEYLSIDAAVTGEIFFNITSSAFWGSIYSAPAFHPDPDLGAYVGSWLSQAAWIQKRFAPNIVKTALRKMVDTLFIVLASDIENKSPSASLPKTRAWAIANDFITLVHRHYARHHDVAYYADRLNISADYLNVVCRQNLGFSAKTRIDAQIIIGIKTLLDTTDLPLKSIADRLHYDNPSYMCRVFRRITGLSPMEFRNRYRHL
ncbi:MAG: helix-turn-helix domain-containing protein [Muribaculaceae bacterium]|nr:helix-turn-helix domain-containing protein [Muribaculaceae bacterium]